MPRTTLALTSFVSGELSPKMDGRTDFEKYSSGCKTLENFLVHPQGAATRRVGSKYVAEVKDSSKKTRLINFEFSTTQTYVLEFSNLFIRFYKDKGQILDSGSPYEIASPYLEAELFDIKFAQSADTMYLTHPNHEVRKLTRSGHTNWTLATVSFSGSPGTAISGANNRPSCVSFFEQRLIFANSINNPQTLWFSRSGDYENMTTGTDADHAMIYTIASNEVNAIRYLKAVRSLIVGTTGGEFTVSADGTDAAVTPTNVTIKRQSSFGSANVDAVAAGNAVLFLQRAKRKIRELAYNFDVDGYTAPDLTILNESVTDTGINQIAYQQEPSSILWCVRDDGILASLTYQRSENVVAWTKHKLGGRFNECTITATDFANIAVGTTLKFTKSDGSTVTFTSEAVSGSAPSSSLGFRPNESNDTTADNIFTAVNAHDDFTVSNPAANIVTVRETSPKAGILTVKSSDTTRLATTDQTNAVVESAASISGSINEDELWVIVKRTINGATKRYVEVFSDFDFDENDQTSFHFVDSGLTYSGSATTSISGLSHLEGETVTILADGGTHSTKKVSSGGITLDRSSKEVVVGLPYNSVLQTMRIEGGAAVGEGTSQGKVKRISKVVLRLFETVGAKVGPSLTKLETIPFRTTTDPMDTPVSTFLAGDKEIEFDGDYESDGFIIVKQEQPLPLSILAIYPTLVTHDG